MAGLSLRFRLAQKCYPSHVTSLLVTAWLVFASTASAQVPPCLVNTTADDAVTPPAGSLRKAIQNANSGTCGGAITFNIPMSDPGFTTDPATGAKYFVIQPLSAPDAITASNLDINGSTQTAFTGDTNPFGPEVWISGASMTAIGNGLSISAGSNNVSGVKIRHLAISGFDVGGAGQSNGIQILGGFASFVASFIDIFSNYIGTDPTGTKAEPNTFGIRFAGAVSNVNIGSFSSTDGNIVSGNVAGIVIGIGAAGIQIIGNRIGTDRTGNVVLPQTIGINDEGSSFIVANTVGGSADAGIRIGGSPSISGNKIGIGMDGISPIPNTTGIDVLGGGNFDIASNTIARNTGVGIIIRPGVTQVGIDNNTIHSNGGLGIDLGGDGVTPNDAMDPDTGPNNLQNFPVITAVRFGPAPPLVDCAGQTTVEGSLNSLPATGFLIQLFKNTSADPSGFGEGEIFVGNQFVTTDAAGNASFSFILCGNEAMKFFTGTASRAIDFVEVFDVIETSEFSAAVKNRPPNAVADFASTALNTPVTTNVLANDSDPDGDALSITGNTFGTNGTASCSGTNCTYTPNPAFSGTDTYTYTISDTVGQTSTATVTVTVAGGGQADLSVFKHDEPDPAEERSVLTYTINVENLGPDSASNVVMADQLPANMTFASAQGDGWSCSFDGTFVICQRAALAVGPAPPIRILASPETPGTYVNTATVTSSIADPNLNNNSSSAETMVLTSQSFCPTSVTILPISSEPSGTIRWVADADFFEVFFGEEGVGCSLRQFMTVARQFAYGPLERDKRYEVRVVAHRGACQPVSSPCVVFSVCPTGFVPKLGAVPESHSDLPVRLELLQPEEGELPGGPYLFQFSTSPLFPNNPAETETRRTDNPFAIFIRSVIQRTPFFGRATLACNPDGWSETVRVVYLPTPSTIMEDPELVGQFQVVDEPMNFTLGLTFPGSQGLVTIEQTTPPPTNATVSTDKAHLSTTPTNVTVPPSGTATVQGSANPQGLPVGTTTGTVVVTNTNTGSTISTVPVSVTLTTPLVPVSKTAAPDNAMIIPVIAKAEGVRASYRSDLRLLNTATVPIKYQLTLTPSDTDGTVQAKQTSFTIDPGQTVAFDDVAEKQFGIGSLGESGSGVLEIRPLDFAGKFEIEPQALEFATVASARSYNDTAGGTFGAFVPGISFSKAIGQPAEGQKSVLSVQHVAQNERYRSNIGLVEGLGQPATVLARVFNLAGQKIDEFTMDVPPAGHFQVNGILARRNIDVQEARMEFEVVSGGGKVLIYASVLENSTGDSLFVPGTNPAGVASSRFLVPAALENNDSKTDLRLFNASTSPLSATLTFYPVNQAAAQGIATVTVAPGEVKAIDGALSALFGLTNTFGAISVTIPTAAPLIVTAHSYTQRPNGIVGQFIEAATPENAAGAATRSLQVLQLEESDRFRSDLGLAEVAGAPATVEITATVADSKTESKLLVPLQANEFRELTSVLKLLNLGRIYNGRVSVRVVSGSGKVFAYGSLVDLQTQDLVFIPGQ